MNDVTEYFKLVSRYCFGKSCKPSMEARIQQERMFASPPLYNRIQSDITCSLITDTRLSHTLLRQNRSPCFPQLDLTLRAILYEKRPRFVVLFSHQTTSYSQIFFTDPSYVPDEELFYDYPTGCPNPCCTDDCEIIRFPRTGLETASLLQIKTKKGRRRVKAKDMCNWIDCDVSFGDPPSRRMSTSGSSEGSEGGLHDSLILETIKINGHFCSKCKLVKYCCPDHQRKDWEEHRRVCVKL